MRSIEERFWSKANKTETCWLWTGALNNHGYGKFSLGGKSIYAHRYAYELLVGPIPNGLTLDHLCRVPACVYPAHLEAVTQRENTLRGEGIMAVFARQTHCLRGHILDEANIYRLPSQPRSRYCRECIRMRQRESYRAKMVAEIAPEEKNDHEERVVTMLTTAFSNLIRGSK